MMVEHSPHERHQRNGPIWLIAAALTLWGLYLAVGSTGAFATNAGFFDVRKFFIVAACSAAFLAFWYGNLRLAKSSEGSDRSSVSISSWLALGLSVLAYVFWGAAYAVNDELAVKFGYVSVVLFGCSMVAAMIGISDRAPKRGRTAGLVAFLAFLLAIAIFVVQVVSYTRRL